MNGPGETWNWARPLCSVLKERGFRVKVLILPCQFASGFERDMASRMGADEVQGPISLTSVPGHLINGETDLVFQLGGDLIWGYLLSRLEKVPFLAYAYGFKKGMSRCQMVFTAFDIMAEEMASRGARVCAVGDLVMDSLDNTGKRGRSPVGTGKVLFLPGSRPKIRSRGMEFMSETCRILRELDDTLQVSALLTDHLREEEEEIWLKRGFLPCFSGKESSFPYADLAVTQPGTNNMELMHMGIPSIIAIPFGFLDEIPLDGIRHFICTVPFWGKKLKRAFLEGMNEKINYVSWPNRIAQRELQEELRGYFTPRDLAVHIFRRVNDINWLKEKAEGSLKLSSQSRKDPSLRIVDMIERLI